jgi:hypothetical protein
VLFKCDWFKLDGKRRELKNDGYFTSINIQNLWYKNDSFILATQARKVFYVPDTKYGENWRIVQNFDHRHLYNVFELDAPAYQDEECCEDVRVRKGVSDNICAQTLTRDDEKDNMIEAAESMAREQTTTVFDDNEDDEVDDTLMAYCSGNEEEQDVDSDDE